MPATIVPVASSLYLVDGVIGFPGGKTDLVGIFNTINAGAFPHLQKHFVVYARLVQGLGRITFFIEIRDAQAHQLWIFRIEIKPLNWPLRFKE